MAFFHHSFPLFFRLWLSPELSLSTQPNTTHTMCEPDVVYFGREVPPGKTVHLTPTDAADDDDDDGVSLVHVTQVALGPTPAPGRHTVFAVHDGAKVPVGTLQVGVCEQFAVDLMWSALAGAPHAGAVAFAHTGASSVYVSGYKTVTSLLDDASDGGEPASDEFDSEESEGESEEESEEEEAGGGRRAVKVSGERVCAWTGRRARAPQAGV